MALTGTLEDTINQLTNRGMDNKHRPIDEQEEGNLGRGFMSADKLEEVDIY